MLGKDFERMCSVFEISDTQSCQRNRINLLVPEYLYLRKSGVFTVLLMKGILTCNLAQSFVFKSYGMKLKNVKYISVT